MVKVVGDLLPVTLRLLENCLWLNTQLLDGSASVSFEMLFVHVADFCAGAYNEFLDAALDAFENRFALHQKLEILCAATDEAGTPYHITCVLRVSILYIV